MNLYKFLKRLNESNDEAVNIVNANEKKITISKLLNKLIKCINTADIYNSIINMFNEAENEDEKDFLKYYLYIDKDKKGNTPNDLYRKYLSKNFDKIKKIKMDCKAFPEYKGSIENLLKKINIYIANVKKVDGSSLDGLFSRIQNNYKLLDQNAIDRIKNETHYKNFNGSLNDLNEIKKMWRIYLKNILKNNKDIIV